MSQSLADILLHIVFSTKGRCEWIKPPIEYELYCYLRAISHERNCPVMEIGGISDHIHLLVSLNRSISVSQLILDLKANSSRWMKTKGFLYQTFSWQNGYGVFSVARRNVDAVAKYIRSQKEHHNKISFQEEFLSMLRQSQIKFDERYLWD